jgi:nitrogen regulatory protein P-II 1
VKLITVVVRQAAFDALKEALALFGVRGMTVEEVYRTSDRTAHVEIYRGQRFASDVERCLKIDLLAPDDESPDLIRVIAKIIATADPVGGRSWTTPVDLAVRVRTSEYGLDAL